MATPRIAQSSVEFVHHSAVDIKVPATLKFPVNGWPQHITDILSPDLKIGETSPPARQLDHENISVSLRMSPTPMVAPSSKTGTSLISTTNASLTTTHDDSLASTEEHSLLSTPKTSLSSSPDIGITESRAALNSDNESTLSEKPVKDLALRVLDIIQSYGHGTGAGTGAGCAGKVKVLHLVELCIQKNEPVKMILPAFPCVSVFDFTCSDHFSQSKDSFNEYDVFGTFHKPNIC